MGNNELKNIAIVNKIEKILNSANYIDSARIVIEIARDEVTCVQYSIKEFITPETDKSKEA